MNRAIFNTTEIGPTDKRRRINICCLRCLEQPHDAKPFEFERFEMQDRVHNLHQFGYDHSAEDWALAHWPATGIDRAGEEC